MTKNETIGTPYYENEMTFSNSCPKNILMAILGVVILLTGMWITSTFSEGVTNSIINIIALDIAITFVIKNTRIENLLGIRVTFVSVLIISFVVLLNIWLGASVVYKDFLHGISSSLSEHYEHSLMYTEMSTIATRLRSGMSLSQATFGLPLYQYYNIFVYSTVMFLTGGINVTNMCIWGGIHTFLCAIFVVLMFDKYGITDKSHLRVSYFVALLQPLFLSVNTYNKVIIGEALVMIALYIFMTTYERPTLNLACLPLYGYLLWTVRLQYLIIAGLLFVLCLSHNKFSKKIIIPISITFIALAIFISKSSFVQLLGNLNFGRYSGESGYDLSLSSIPARIIRSFLPYFPLTNIADDRYWYFNIFCILQEIMNITLWGLVFISHGKINISHAKSAVSNPFIITAFALLLGGTFSEMHTTYLSVGTMLLPAAFDDNVSGNKVAVTFIVVLLSVVLLSFIYVALGLSGSGVAGVTFGQ